MKSKIRVLLADDHLVVRMGIETLLSLEGDLEVVGGAETGVEALQLARELRPDVILMDVMMPKKSGTDAAIEILRELPGTRILLITSFGGTPEVRKALDAGAVGVLSKTATRAEIVSAIHCATREEKAVSEVIGRQLEQLDASPTLTLRQQEVLNLVAKGFSNQEIGGMLGTGEDAVKKHLKNVFALLGVSTRAEAVSRAANLGLITG